MSHGSRTLVVLIALAMSLSGWLPAPHAHLDRGGAIVHAHSVTDLGAHHADHDDHDAVEHHATVEHGDHSAALSLVPSYQVGSRFVLTVAAVTEVTSVAACSVVSNACKLNRKLLPTHDPPLRFTSSPAPPVVV